VFSLQGKEASKLAGNWSNPAGNNNNNNDNNNNTYFLTS
jgi:hypothetical protein